MNERVLIVDDHPVNREILRAILEKVGYVLDEAVDGKDAIAQARRSPPDIILMDVMMPEMNGYDVCLELKKDPRFADVPVIFLSAMTQTVDKVRGLEAGAVDYVTKPFNAGEVLARIRTQLQVHQLSRSLREANRRLAEKQRNLDEDLAAAASIQRSLMRLPAPSTLKRFVLASRFLPCETVGGDVFNVESLGAGRFAMYMVDVSGHGVPAAMVTVAISQSLLAKDGHLIQSRPDASSAPRVHSPAEVLAGLAREYPIDRFDKHFTIAYALLDEETGRFSYSCAGHPPPLLVAGGGGRVEWMEKGGTIIGIGDDLPFEEGRLTLRAGDRVFLYTDGLIELTAASGEMFGSQRLTEVLTGAAGEPLETACDRLFARVAEHAGGRAPQDDITLLAVEYRGG